MAVGGGGYMPPSQMVYVSVRQAATGGHATLGPSGDTTTLRRPPSPTPEPPLLLGSNSPVPEPPLLLGAPPNPGHRSRSLPGLHVTPRGLQPTRLPRYRSLSSVTALLPPTPVSRGQAVPPLQPASQVSGGRVKTAAPLTRVPSGQVPPKGREEPGMWKMVCGAPHWDVTTKKMWSPGPQAPREPVKLPFLEVTPTTVLQRIRDRASDHEHAQDDRGGLALWTTDTLDLSRTAPADLGGYRGVYLGKLRQGSSYGRSITVEKGYSLLPNKYGGSGLGSARGDRGGARSPRLVSPSLHRRINALAPLDTGEGPVLVSRAASTHSVIPPLSAVSRRSAKIRDKRADLEDDFEEDDEDDENLEYYYDDDDDDDDEEEDEEEEEEIEEEEVEEEVLVEEEGTLSRPKSSATTRDSGISVFSVSHDGEALTEIGRTESRYSGRYPREVAGRVSAKGAKGSASSLSSTEDLERSSYDPGGTQGPKKDVSSSRHSLPNEVLRPNGFGVVGKGLSKRPQHPNPGKNAPRNSPANHRDFHNFDYESDFESDDDVNNITLSNTTLTKMKLLKKKRDNMKEIDRRRQERDTKKTQEERLRKYRQLELQHSQNSLQPSRNNSGDSTLAVEPNLSYKGRTPRGSPRRSPRPSPRPTPPLSPPQQRFSVPKSKSHNSNLSKSLGNKATPTEKRHRSLERHTASNDSNSYSRQAFRTPQLVRRGQPPVGSGSSSLSNSLGSNNGGSSTFSMSRRNTRKPPTKHATLEMMAQPLNVLQPTLKLGKSPGSKPAGSKPPGPKPPGSERPSPVGQQRPQLKHHLAPQLSTESRSSDEFNTTIISVGMRSSKPASSCFKTHLEPFVNPHEAMRNAHQLLDSGDWESQVEGIQDMVRLNEHHPEVLQSDLHNVNLALLKQAKNLRSQVSRAAIQAFTRLFDTLKRSMEPDVEKIVNMLLNRTADTNKFLQLDSHHGLDALVENVSPTKSIPAIVQEGLSHRNAAVRTTVARLLAYEVERLGPSRVLSGQKDITDRLLPAAAKLAQEGSLETRKYAKQIFQALIQQGQFDAALKKFVSANEIRNIQKFLDNLTNEGRNIQESARSKFSVGSRYTRTM